MKHNSQITHVEHIKKRKTLVGVVRSTKMGKTVVVEVVTTFRHPIYKKATRKTKRYAVHNELPDIAQGDKVQIAQIKPMSKTKHFIIVSKL
ncbi:30S ribosomal protein S17 [Candidatus Gottesmanbacteria bacterium RIFCSPLOWO2_01_FULL_49_10]|uniref:Small ribosomal subunit protein uS17 n=1 Tax=Candidatus Gottesmanbacteria bacterium RIFCSPLOWO2_01_FULL_49_10 TaxID=1798396 RepID=A0A1F6AXY7_9BACT|nr:MAG: 30S ribosomal protein S17 [Microgenomates group bacterium GW2011_GWA2_47_8]OGG29362.1 MAG: 30S ribosomal protein S17 [Candidatus Gottesmanbacteria bacterium RIFCSPLOWO2_01_FULL_49_10]